VEYIAWYCPSTAQVECPPPTEAMAATIATSTEDNWISTFCREVPSKENWNSDIATTFHIGGDQRNVEQYTENHKRDEWQIWYCAQRVADTAIGHGDVWLGLRLPPGHRSEVIVTNVFCVKGAHNMQSQSALEDHGLWIV